MGVESYPSRPAFFVAKFVRLLAKSCVANELGPDAMALLVVIVGTEDARGYRGPVNFWNGQLLPLIGCRSDSTFRRLRDRCERAGWLKHVPGTKWTPPSYWVTIPAQFDGWDDAPSDEGRGKYETVKPRHEQATGEQAAGERRSSGVLGAHERTESFPIPGPEPVPTPSAGVPPTVAAVSKPPPKRPAKPKQPRPRNELFDAVATVTGIDPATAGSLIGKVSAALAGASPPYTPDDVREFGRQYWQLCSWARDQQRDRPTPNELQTHIGKLRAGPADLLPAKPRPVPTAFDRGAATEARIWGQIVEAIPGLSG